MVTRRTLLKQGAYATLAAATAPTMIGTARAQSASSGSFDFYISPSGSDSNPGTRGQPWAITAINTHRNDYAGKRVGLLDGTYNVYELCQTATGRGAYTALAVNGGSSPASPTVIAAVNARQAILTAANPSGGEPPTTEAGIIGQGYQQVPNKGNVILDGLFITRGWYAGVFFFPALPPNPEGGATGIVVRNCEIYDIDGIVAHNMGGLKLRCCTGALISNNTIHSVQPNPGTANAENAAGIFSFNCYSNVYEYNTIFDCNCGIHDKNPQNGNHTYRYNYIEIAGAYPAAALADGSGGNAGDVVTVHNNVLIAPQSWDGSDMSMPSKQSMTFYNNTCVGGGIFYLAAGPQVSPPALVTFYNNIVGTVKFCTGSVLLSDYNLFSTTRGTFGLSSPATPHTPATLYSLSEWQKVTGQDRNSITPIVTPTTLFVGAAPLNSAGYKLHTAALGRMSGRVGGVAAGAPTGLGAWGGGATRIGSDFSPRPRSPVLRGG